MCTAVSFLSGSHYFGRNLDLEFHYQESVAVTPRNFPLILSNKSTMVNHYAMIGIATVDNGYPLYYDATNEHGLSMAGLNFPGNAFYQTNHSGQNYIAPYELIPWILGKCKSSSEALKLLKDTAIGAIPYSDNFPLTGLHWILCDREYCYTIEPLKHGLNIQENPVGVLTNNPPFDYHMQNLCNYLSLSNHSPENKIAPEITLEPHSRGMGAMGLPGDLSSSSRFIRAVFTKFHSTHPESETEAVSQFFHILGSVVQQEGCVQINDAYEKTVYTSCCNTDAGIYYFQTYDNPQILAVNMHVVNLNGKQIVQYPVYKPLKPIFIEKNTAG